MKPGRLKVRDVRADVDTNLKIQLNINCITYFLFHFFLISFSFELFCLPNRLAVLKKRPSFNNVLDWNERESADFATPCFELDVGVVQLLVAVQK